MAKLYEMLDEVYGNTQLILSEFEHRQIRENIDKKLKTTHRKQWDLIDGIHTLTEDEILKINFLGESLKNLYGFYRSHKIYLPAEICTEIEQFLTMTHYTATNYSNVAIKDNNGELMVNPKV